MTQLLGLNQDLYYNIRRLSPILSLSADVAVQLPDKKSIIMYVTSLFAVLPNDITMDDIREVETLPRRFRLEGEEAKTPASPASLPVVKKGIPDYHSVLAVSMSSVKLGVGRVW